MRLPGIDRDCGPLLDLNHIQRQLRLEPPVYEGEATIPVSQIIGTVGRARDFDGCFRPVHAPLRKRIRDIADANPRTLDEAIEVVRVDRAYFVSDGHKRVAIARETGREFIDARVSHMPSPYALTPEVEADAIERTAREGEFRRHSGLADGVPDARFPLTELSGYGELLIAVQSYSYDRVLATGTYLPPPAAARRWYEEKYLPTVAAGKEVTGGLVDAITDADIFLTLHRQERAAWGGECGEPQCAADMLLAEQRRAAARARTPLDRLLNRDGRARNAPALLLPMADEIHAAERD